MNEEYPSSRIRVTVPQEGRYSYTLDASAVFKGSTEEFSGAVGAIRRGTFRRVFATCGTVATVFKKFLGWRNATLRARKNPA